VTNTTLRGSLKRKSIISASENGYQTCNKTEQSVELLARKQDLIKSIQEKEDSLRKLKLVKMYRNKVDLSCLLMWSYRCKCHIIYVLVIAV